MIFSNSRRFLLLSLVATLGTCVSGATTHAQIEGEPLVPTYLLHRDLSAPLVGEFTDERLLIDETYHGIYSRRRQLLQDRLLKTHLEGGTTSTRPRLIFITGPIGAGKTWVRSELERLHYLDPSVFLTLDPDQIKGDIPEYTKIQQTNPELAANMVHRESNYLLELATERALLLQKNIVLDLAMRDVNYFKQIVTRIQKTQPQYQIEIIHVTNSLENMLKNANERAIKTGRYVDDEVVEASLADTKVAIDTLRPLVHRVFDIDNTTHPDLKRLAETETFKQLASEQTPPIPSSTLDIIFDIDLTLVEEIKTTDPRYAAANAGSLPRTITIEGIIYQIIEGAEKLVNRISALPQVRVSYMSGGAKSRNLKLLRAVHAQGGGTWYDQAYRVLSRSDLPLIEVKKDEFRLKKDVRKINPDLDRVLLLDDIPSFILSEHLENQLWLGEIEALHERLIGHPRPAQSTLEKAGDILEHAIRVYTKTGRAMADTLNDLRAQPSSCNPLLHP